MTTDRTNNEPKKCNDVINCIPKPHHTCLASIITRVFPTSSHTGAMDGDWTVMVHTDFDYLSNQNPSRKLKGPVTTEANIRTEAKCRIEAEKSSQTTEAKGRIETESRTEAESFATAPQRCKPGIKSGYVGRRTVDARFQGASDI